MAFKFDQLERLGSGYFGEVWRVMDLGLGIERAVKLIPKDKIPDQDNFFREAQILKTAEHHNVVKVEETGMTDDGRLYVAMEYLPRGSVADESKGGFIALTRAKTIMIDALRGLQHAHSKGVIHRDIKPGNILLGASREAKLSDFGLAIDQNVASLGSRVHEYNYFAHRAPEEFRTKRNFSALTDIYSCGVTFYRLVNGDSFLPSISVDELRKRVQTGKFPDRKKYRYFVPQAIRRIINQSINIEPNKRFTSAEDMRHAIERVELHMNFTEHRSSKNTRWIGSHDGRCFEVQLAKVGRKWSLLVRRGKSKDSLRKISVHCLTDATKREADVKTRRVLQDIVLGKIK